MHNCLHKFKTQNQGKNKTLVEHIRQKLKSRIWKKITDTILDKTKRTFNNGKVSVILSILVQFHCIVGILSNCT